MKRLEARLPRHIDLNLIRGLAGLEIEPALDAADCKAERPASVVGNAAIDRVRPAYQRDGTALCSNGEPMIGDLRDALQCFPERDVIESNTYHAVLDRPSVIDRHVGLPGDLRQDFAEFSRLVVESHAARFGKVGSDEGRNC